MNQDKCGCGNDTRYQTTSGMACNKHGRCLSFEETTQALTHANIKLLEQEKIILAALYCLQGSDTTLGKIMQRQLNTKLEICILKYLTIGSIEELTLQQLDFAEEALK